MRRAVLLLALLCVIFVGVADAMNGRRKIGLEASFDQQCTPRPGGPSPGDVLSVPHEWKLVGRTAGDQSVRFILALQRRNAAKLEELFWAVSDPRNEQYGQFRTHKQLRDLIGVSQDVYETVLEWLESHGIDEASTELNGHHDRLTVRTTASKLESLLDVYLFDYVHAETSRTHTTSITHYRLPSHIAPHLELVAGVTGFPLGPRKYPEHSRRGASDTTYIAQYPTGPLTLRSRYNVTSDPDASAASNSSQAVAEFQGQYYSQRDLTTYFELYAPDFANYSTVGKVVGTNDASYPGDEASLDIQDIMGVAPGIYTEFWSYSSFDFWGDLEDWYNDLSNRDDPPLVNSVSYGEQAPDPAWWTKDALNKDFQALGVLGLSIIVASGDDGTGCSFCVFFEPSFPAGSPYVTAVGSTRFLDYYPGPEAATENFSSGGGFSRWFEAPDYQKDIVDQYWSTSVKKPDEFRYFKGNRATPDVAALGIGYEVVIDGAEYLIGGTSAATPTFAAIVSLLNEIRLDRGDSPLGFLNPFLYQTYGNVTDAFFDVTVGSNTYTGFLDCCGDGFNCAPGWDPVTGLGTPNFEVLAQLV